MIDVPVAYAFTAGLVATVNPCGFPMLPAYLSYFIGLDDADVDRNGRVPRALMASGAVSLGFLAVFTALGIPIHAGMTWIYRVMPWFTLVVGAALLVLGLAMLTGHRLKIALPRLDQGGSSRRFRSMVLFGVSYAVASLSCTLPIFLVVVAGTAERANPVSGLIAFVAYGAGMSLVLTVVSVALALARESLVRRLRSALRYADRAAGVLLMAVGVYLLYYGVYAMDPANSAAISPIGVVGDWSAAAATWLNEGGTGLGLVLAGLVGAAVTGVLVHRFGRSRGGTPVQPPDAGSPDGGAPHAASTKPDPSAVPVAAGDHES